MKIPKIKQRKIWGSMILLILGTFLIFFLDADKFNAWTIFAIFLFGIFVGGNEMSKRSNLKYKDPQETDHPSDSRSADRHRRIGRCDPWRRGDAP